MVCILWKIEKKNEYLLNQFNATAQALPYATILLNKRYEITWAIKTRRISALVFSIFHMTLRPYSPWTADKGVGGYLPVDLSVDFADDLIAVTS